VATENSQQGSDISTPLVKPGHYNPVIVHFQDFWGTIFLGILAVILLIGWILAEKRSRNTIKQHSVEG
jgi:hypothetical protein